MYNNTLRILEEIVAPTSCPTCGGEIEAINSQLFCRNSDCSSQKLKKLEHFTKTMKIKGLGPKTIEKLVDNELLNEIYDIYDLEVNDLSPILGEKVAEKLIQEIEASKTTSLSTFICAFSIPLVGLTASKKLEVVLKDLEDILSLDETTCIEAGLGKTTANNLLEWVENYFCNNYKAFTRVISIIKPNTLVTKSLGTVVITGKFDTARSVLESQLASLGYDVKDSVSSKTQYLLCADVDSTSSKVVKAKSLGIKIVTSIDELKANIAENK